MSDLRQVKYMLPKFGTFSIRLLDGLNVDRTLISCLDESIYLGHVRSVISKITATVADRERCGVLCSGFNYEIISHCIKFKKLSTNYFSVSLPTLKR